MSQNKDNKTVFIALIVVLSIICGLLIGAIIGVAINRKGSSEEITTDEQITTEEIEYTSQQEDEYVTVEATTEGESERVTEREPETYEKNSPSSSDKLTKEVLTSHSWYIVMQAECEYIFHNDGSYEAYGMGYYTGTYSIQGNNLILDNMSYEYTSLEDNEDIKNDEIFMSMAGNKLNRGERFFYCEQEYSNLWLIDATGRCETDKEYCIYRNFALEEYEGGKWSKNYEAYIYAEYYMIDVDEDGTKELIVHEGTCEQDRKYYFYTIKNKEIIYLGSLDAWHSTLCDNDGYLIRYDGISGEGDYYKVTISNGSVKEAAQGSFTFPPVPDFGETLQFFPTMY